MDEWCIFGNKQHPGYRIHTTPFKVGGPGEGQCIAFHESDVSATPHELQLYVTLTNKDPANLLSQWKLAGILTPVISEFKGPIYTMPGEHTINMSGKRNREVKVGLSYKYPDTPPFKISDAVIPIDNEHPLNRYAVIPFIKNLQALSQYNMDICGAERETVIVDMAVSTEMDNQTVTMYYQDGDRGMYPIGGRKHGFLNRLGFDDYTEEFFKKIKTDVLFVRGLGIVIIHIPNTSICYIIPYEEYEAWDGIGSVDIEIFRNNELDGDPTYSYSMEGLIEIFKGCLYLPDIFYFDSSFYEEDLSYRLRINYSRSYLPIHATVLDYSYINQFERRMSLYNILRHDVLHFA